VSKGFLTAAKQGTILNLRVSPGAKRTSIEGPYGENAIKLKVAAPPADGKANAEVERFLAELLDVPRSDVTIVRGATSRDKQVLIRNLAYAQTQKALSTHLL
jgi:uncharacterized protein